MKKVLLSSLLVIGAYAAQAQWTQNQALEGGTVTSLAKIGSNVFCATNGGVFMSSDNAANWNFAGKGIGTNIGRLAVDRLVVNGNTLIAGSGMSFSRTTDNGTTWASTTYTPKAPTDQVISMVVFNNAVYATMGMQAGFGGGGGAGTNYLVKSTDNTATFTEITTVPEAVANGTLTVANGTLFSVSDTILSSTNGTTFTGFSMAGLPADANYISPIVGDGTNLFITSLSFGGGVPSGGVYRYSTLTSSWSASSTGLPAAGLAFGLYSANGTVFVGEYDITSGTPMLEIYKTSNGGTVWTKMAGTGLAVQQFTDVKALDATTIIGAFPDGVYTTANNGDNWTLKNNKLTATVHTQSINFNNNYFTNLATPFSLLKSADNGATLAPVAATGTITGGFRSFARSNTSLFMGFRTGNGRNAVDTLFKSTDNGATFSTVETPGYEGEQYLLAGNSGNNVFLRATGQGLDPFYYVSKNDGDSWDELKTPAGAKIAVGLAANSNVVYLWGRTSTNPNLRVYLSTNLGTNWTLDTAGFRKEFRSASMACGEQFMFLATYDSVAQKIDLFTQKPTSAWVKLPALGLPSNTQVQQLHVYKKAIYVVTPAGLFISKDGGKSFTGFNDGLYDGLNKTSIAFVGPNALLTTNGNGVWKSPAPEGVDPDVALSVSSKERNAALLGQNFPNPAKDITTINYTLDHNEQINLSIYDMHGRLVQTVVNETKAAGNYSVAVEMSSMAPGVYNYQLNTPTATTVKQLIVIE